MHLKTLKNGLRILTLPSINNEVSIHIIVNVGHFDEEEIRDQYACNYSKAHIIEHMIADTKKRLKEISDKMIVFDAATYGDFTTYDVTIEHEDFDFVMPKVLDMLKNRKFEKELVERETRIIDNEFMAVRGDVAPSAFDPLKPRKAKPLTEAEINNIKSLTFSYIEKRIDDLRTTNFNQKNLQEYYEQHYVPEKMVFTIRGGTEQEIEALTKKLEEMYANSPAKAPFVKTPKLANKKPVFPEQKFTLKTLEGDLTDFSRIKIFIPLPNNSEKYGRCARLFDFLMMRNSHTSFNGLLFTHTREQKHAVYGVAQQSVFLGENAYTQFSFSTKASNVKKTLKSIRFLIDSIASSKIISGQEFKKLKQRYIEVSRKDLAANSGDTYQALLPILSAYEKIRNQADFEKQILEIRYEDFVNYVKFLSKTNNYFVTGEGNMITMEDLQAFQTTKLEFSNKDVKKFFKTKEMSIQPPVEENEDDEFEEGEESFEEEIEEEYDKAKVSKNKQTSKQTAKNDGLEF